MEGKDIYILLAFALVCWQRPVSPHWRCPVASPAITLRLTGDHLTYASLAITLCLAGDHLVDDALLALLGLTTETRPTHNKKSVIIHSTRQSGCSVILDWELGPRGASYMLWMC